MENIFPGNAFRVGGYEFVIIETGIVKAQFFQKLDELRREMEKRKENFSIGVLWRENENDIVTMLKEADNIMYTEKKKYHLENKEL